MNEFQQDILKLALGWPDFKRNHFVVHKDSVDKIACEELERDGYMTLAGKMGGGTCIYSVSSDGIRFIESLTRSGQ